MTMEIKNIAKLSSYGAYIDEEFIYTNSLVEGKNVIVGDIAEYMYDLEQELAKKESETAQLAIQRFINQLHIDEIIRVDSDLGKELLKEKEFVLKRYYGVDFTNS